MEPVATNLHRVDAAIGPMNKRRREARWNHTCWLKQGDRALEERQRATQDAWQESEFCSVDE